MTSVLVFHIYQYSQYYTDMPAFHYFLFRLWRLVVTLLIVLWDYLFLLPTWCCGLLLNDLPFRCSPFPLLVFFSLSLILLHSMTSPFDLNYAINIIKIHDTCLDSLNIFTKNGIMSTLKFFFITNFFSLSIIFSDTKLLNFSVKSVFTKD